MVNRHFLLVFLLLISVHLPAQLFFDFGLKGGYGASFLINKNVYNDKHIVPNLSFGGTFGAKVGINFNETHSITLDVMYAQVNQSYIITSDTNNNLRVGKSIQLTTLDFPLLYRHYSDEGTYFEVGPQYSILLSANQDFGGTKQNIASSFVSQYYAGVFGFGASFIGSNKSSLLVGFRISYGFTDLMNERTKVLPGNDSFYTAVYKNYATTNPLTIQLIAEWNFDIGYFTRSKCNKHHVSFLSF